MDNQKKSASENMKIAPSTHNDQLGENAAEEFASDYDNKSNSTTKQNNKNNSSK